MSGNGQAVGGSGVRSRPPRAGFLAMSGILLGVAAAITIVLHAMDPVFDPRGILMTFVISSLVSFCIGLPVWFGWRYVVPPLVAAYPSALTLAAAGGGVIVVGVVGGSIASSLIVRLLGGHQSGPFFLNLVLRIGLVVAVVFSVVLVAAHRLLAESHARRLEAEEARRRAAEARLEALRARIHPHFLFNALNTIAGLIHDDPRAAEEAVEELARLLRYTLEVSRAEQVPLGDELAIVRRYLALERARLGERLRYDIAVEEGLETLAVPPLLVLPLVENAVRHGIAPRRDGGLVTITARREDSVPVITVEDDGPGLAGSTTGGTGTSLADLRARLALLGGTLETGPADGGGFRARIRLPGEATAEATR